MPPYLGTRGRFATLIVVALAMSGAVYAATDKDWAALAALVVLTYLAVLMGASWGALQVVLQTTTDVAKRQQRIARRQGAQARLLRTKLHRTYLRLARMPASTPGPASNPVERRYAGVLDQPVSAPNSRLLGLLELLAKDATTRRADDAGLRQAVGELRSLVEMQQVEINRLHELAARGDSFAAHRSPV